MKTRCLFVLFAALSMTTRAESGPTFREHPTVVSVATNQRFSIPLRALLSNGGAGTLTWSALTAMPIWATLNTATERIEGLPPVGAVGDHTFRLSVKDNLDRGDITPFTFTVFSPNAAPEWLKNPVVLDGLSVGQPLSLALNPWVRDEENDPISFRKIAGPSWITLSSEGNITGTPPALGTFTAVVEAFDAFGGSQADVRFVVNVSERIDRITIDKGQLKSEVEVLWAIDHSIGSQALGHQLKSCIGTYFDKVRNAGVTSHGVYISADGYFGKGVAVPSSTGQILIDSDNANVAADFRKRMEKSYTNASMQATPTYNSFLALQKAATLETVGFLAPNVALHLFLFSDENDMYRSYQSRTAQKNWTSTDYLDYFHNVASSRGKALRIFAVGPDSKNNTFPFSNVENMFKVLPPQANGVLFPVQKYKFRMNDVLSELGQAAIDDAAQGSEMEYPLSTRPRDAMKIVVRLDGFELPGNTGASDDLWTYDAANNSVRVFWNRMDVTNVPDGAMLEIRYPI